MSGYKQKILAKFGSQWMKDRDGKVHQILGLDEDGRWLLRKKGSNKLTSMSFEQVDGMARCHYEGDVITEKRLAELMPYYQKEACEHQYRNPVDSEEPRSYIYTDYNQSPPRYTKVTYTQRMRTRTCAKCGRTNTSYLKVRDHKEEEVVGVR